MERGVRLKIIFFTKQRAKKIRLLLHQEQGLREQKALNNEVGGCQLQGWALFQDTKMSVP